MKSSFNYVNFSDYHLVHTSARDMMAYSFSKYIMVHLLNIIVALKYTYTRWYGTDKKSEN